MRPAPPASGSTLTVELRREQLLVGQRLAALGQIAGSLAHEINNPNTVVLLNAGLLQKICAALWPLVEAQVAAAGELRIAGLSLSDARATLEGASGHVLAAAQRISQTVATLRTFARSAEGGPQAVNLNAIVEQALAMMAPAVHRATDALTLSLAPQPLVVEGRPQELMLVVVNLVSNALASLPARERAVEVSTLADGATGEVVLQIDDRGVGMAAEVLARAGEPFFSTQRGGLGLGLYVVRELVEAYHGSFALASEPGRGTRAMVRWPGGRATPGP